MDDAPDDLCPQCREDLLFHCKAGSVCNWTVCPECKLTIDRVGLRMLRGVTPVPWPHSKPSA